MKVTRQTLQRVCRLSASRSKGVKASFCRCECEAASAHTCLMVTQDDAQLLQAEAQTCLKETQNDAKLLQAEASSGPPGRRHAGGNPREG